MRLKMWVFSVFLAVSIMLMPARGAFAQCSANPVSGTAYNIYVHNSGLLTSCVQDHDLDLVERNAFLTSYSSYLASAITPIIGDYFDATECSLVGKEPHGVVVKRYFDFTSGRSSLQVCTSDYPEWYEMVEYITDTYPNSGRVVNLSTGLSISGGPTGWYVEWGTEEIDAICAAYDSGLVLSGPSPVWIDHPKYGGLEDFGDKVLMSMPMNSLGELCNYSPDPDWVNACYICVPTNWTNGTSANLAVKSPNVPTSLTSSYVDEGFSGSYTSGLFTGSIQRIADVVYSRGYRGGEFVDKVLDYVISACDRNVDPESYSAGSGEFDPIAPWSSTWGYGVFSPWKSLLYAYGFGEIEAKDAELDTGNGNPPMVFSDHFFLRGDLYVPEEQTLRISELGSVSIDPDITAPEGPASIGLYPTLNDIRVAGDFEIASPWMNGGVTSTVVVDSCGTCTVEDGGLLTIQSGMILHVRHGGTLDLEEGGEIRIFNGGKLLIEGAFNYSGYLCLSQGSTIEFTNTADLYLEADINIPANSVFQANLCKPWYQRGAVITVAGSDVRSSGADTDRVEIVCEGYMRLSTCDPSYPLVIEGEVAGDDTWAGIVIDSDNSNPSLFSGVEISDAVTGIEMSGTNITLLMNNVISECGTGLKLDDKLGYQVYFSGGEVSGCSTGVELNESDIEITGVTLSDNFRGLKCNDSSPKVRGCLIISNHFGVVTMDSSSIPDLGTASDAGNNNFYGSDPVYPGQANDMHIHATDPSSDIYAQYNYWGTTVPYLIEARLTVVDFPPTAAGEIIYQPVLTGIPLPMTAPEITGRNEEPDRPALGEAGETPKVDYLNQNYPNPFNPITNIDFGLRSRGQIDLSIYDASGRLVRSLVNGTRQPGHYCEVWNGTDNKGHQVANGVYFYRLRTNEFVETKKMILLR